MWLIFFWTNLSNRLGKNVETTVTLRGLEVQAECLNFARTGSGNTSRWGDPFFPSPGGGLTHLMALEGDVPDQLLLDVVSNLRPHPSRSHKDDFKTEQNNYHFIFHIFYKNHIRENWMTQRPHIKVGIWKIFTRQKQTRKRKVLGLHNVRKLKKISRKAE